MELWQALVGFGGLIAAVLVPCVLAAFARDRSIFAALAASDARSAEMKDDCRAMIEAATSPVHDRINRVRDEYVRRDDLDGHLKRIEKRFDDVAAQMVRNAEATDKKLDEIYRLLQRTH